MYKRQHLNALHRERQRLTPIALAYTALALANMERNELADEVLAVRRRYREGTLILETDFETASGAVRVIDCNQPREALLDLVPRRQTDERSVNGRASRAPDAPGSAVSADDLETRALIAL